MNKIKTYFYAIIIFFIFISNLYAYKIITIQHQSLDTYKQILNSYLYHLPDNYKVYSYNANNDINQLYNYVKSISCDNSIDLILTLGTISSKIAIKNIKNIPIIITGMASPEYSGVIKNWKTSNSNWTAVECKNKTYKSLDIVYNIYNFKNLGLIYLINAPSHEGTYKESKKFCKDKNIKLLSCSFSHRDNYNNKLKYNEVKQKLKQCLIKVASEANILYINTSNTFLEHINTITEVANKYNLPIIGTNVYSQYDITISVVSDYYERGLKATKYTIDILKNNIQPKQLPLDVIKNFSIQYNYTNGSNKSLKLTNKFLNHNVNIKIQ